MSPDISVYIIVMASIPLQEARKEIASALPEFVPQKLKVLSVQEKEEKNSFCFASSLTLRFGLPWQQGLTFFLSSQRKSVDDPDTLSRYSSQYEAQLDPFSAFGARVSEPGQNLAYSHVQWTFFCYDVMGDK